jgi:uncharacterized membrane protein
VSKNLLKALPELIQAGIITNEKASEIQHYFQQRSGKSQNRLVIVFGILGSILVGLGIILIIAHNWDELSKSTKTSFAFLPLVVGQLISAFVILRQRESVAWREGASVFLYFAVGASISLVSQIYNIPGNLSSFLLTWMVLCLPLVYLMKSSITAMLVIIGITYFACETSYWSGDSKTSYEYWLVLAATLPHYYLLFKKNPNSNFFILLNWLVPLSVIICLGTLADHEEELMFISYFSLFGLFYIIGNSRAFSNKLVRNNSYLVLGSVGTIVMLLMLSFDWFWNDLLETEFTLATSIEFYIAIIVSLSAGAILTWRIAKSSWQSTHLMEYIFLLFIIIFIIGLSNNITPIILINLLLLILGLLTIKKGADHDHLGILNYGLTVITALVICRFFDTDISFVVRGLLFVIVGAGFFAANYWMIKKRKAHETHMFP